MTTKVEDGSRIEITPKNTFVATLLELVRVFLGLSGSVGVIRIGGSLSIY